MDFIRLLRPVSYTWDIESMSHHLREDTSEGMLDARSAASSIIYSGFLAQEVETAAHQIGYDFSAVVAPQNEHDTYGLRYAEFTVPLVKAVQEQQAQIDGQAEIIITLQKENAELKALAEVVTALSQRLEQLEAQGKVQE